MVCPDWRTVGLLLVFEALIEAGKLANIQFSKMDSLPNIQFIISEFKEYSTCKISNSVNLPFLVLSGMFCWVYQKWSNSLLRMSNFGAGGVAWW